MANRHDKALKELGKNIKRLRIEKGLSIREFALEADIAVSAVIPIESGAANPTYTTLLKISEALQVDIIMLMSTK